VLTERSVGDQDRRTRVGFQILKYFLHAGEQTPNPDVERSLDIFGRCQQHIRDASTSKGGPENSGYAPEIASNCLDGRSNLRRFAGIRHVRGRLDATGLQVGDSVGEPISASSDQGQRVALAPESLCGRLRYSWTITKDNQYTRNRSYLQLALNRQTTSLRFSAPCCDHELDGPT